MSERSLLEAGLRTALPARIETPPNAAFVHGWAFVRGQRITGLTLSAGGVRSHPLAFGMPSPGLPAELGESAHDAADAFFWGVVSLAQGRRSPVDLVVRAQLADGSAVERCVGRIDRTDPTPPQAVGSPAPRVAVCMATHEPPTRLLARQLESLRRQTHRDWICLISDDASSPEAFGELERLVAGDKRFVVSRASERLGVYENFHRVLRQVPDDVAFVALADQDDEWHPDKLSTLLAEIGDAALVYSDMRITDSAGRMIADSYWTRRLPNHENFASLLLGNSVTGAASLFTRALLRDALPFPPRFGNLYHDHWLALVARAQGPIAYVPRPLYDYVQHDRAVIGHAGANLGVVGGGALRRLLALRHRPAGSLRASWRNTYFSEYCRMRLSARVLEMRLGDRIGGRERSALRLIERGVAAAPWLALRQLRRLHRDETHGSEATMLRALAWEQGLRAGLGRGPLDDADLPRTVAGPVRPPA